MKKILEFEIFPLLPIHIASLLQNISEEYLFYLEEIRLRPKQPLMLIANNQDFMITQNGVITSEFNEAYVVTKEDVDKTFQFISQNSVYSIEEELKNGYITVPGGHRVGISGQVLLENQEIKTIKYISGLNIRIARQVIGAANQVLPYIVDETGLPLNTLIISPPKAGKTTMLRDIIRQLSFGVKRLRIKGFNIGLVDERSEIACCYEGIPQNDVGPRTDVLDRCPKAKGMILLLRSMSPDIIATDEIGKKEDVIAIEEVINAGVAIMATVHGLDLNDVKKRPTIRKMINRGYFNRYIILGFSSGIGSIEGIIKGDSLKKIFTVREEI